MITDSLYINGEFINLYSKDNPILEPNDICYCLIMNRVDYHYPLIARCQIMKDKFSDGLNKSYYVRVLEWIETPRTLNRFVIGQSFNLYPFYNEIDMHSKKVMSISKRFKYEKYLFNVEAFFVRSTIEQIKELREFYCTTIKNDLVQMITDLGEIL